MLSNQFQFVLATLLVAAVVAPARAADGQLRLRLESGAPWLQVVGDNDEDWRILASGDPGDWTGAAEVGTLLSGDFTAPALAVGLAGSSNQFFRARRTDGLYDASLLRTFSLTFTQANWQTLMTSGRTTGSNVVAKLELDNGAVIERIGARYKGNSSFSGLGGSAPIKKSINLEVNFVDPATRLLKYRTINLNNAYADETIMREPVYFNVMARYAPSPRGAMARLFINGSYWGVYSLVQQEDSDLVREWFPSNKGDRWKAPNIGGGGGGGGGGFGGSGSALSWLGTNVSSYRSAYELKTSNSTNAWQRLIHACNVLNNTPAAEFRAKIEDVLAVDSWLWFLAAENVFADDDSYWNKGADYGFYYEPESGRIHPIEHDGNEAFVSGDVSLSPVQGATGTSRPVISKLLGVPEFRQRYLAHMRTVLRDAFHPELLVPVIDQFSALSVTAIAADTRKGYPMGTYTNDLRALRTFVTNRFRFLTNHAELRPMQPVIRAVSTPYPPPAGSPTTVTAEVSPHINDGIDSVWLWFRSGPAGRFSSARMFDDGEHGDGAAGDGVYGGAAAGFLAGSRVRYYVEARSANTTKTAAFFPVLAERGPLSYRVTTSAGTASPVVINELMASNSRTLRDPQGDYDDWIELRNLSSEPVDLTGFYLSDNPDNPRKWQFPADTEIAAHGYVLVWADENGGDTPGLHANFKLAANGEVALFVGPDSSFNPLLDVIAFGPQTPDVSFGRSVADPKIWTTMNPTPGQPNR